MESLLTLPLAGEARVRILQITDTHLFAQKHEALLGVNTWDSYQAVLEAIRPHQHEFDLIVATGDLAQDQSSAAYRHFAEGIASFRAPCVWLPGNHDFQPANIHAGGLRYHGAGAIVSQLLKDSLIEAVDIRQLDSFKAGVLFAKTEGIIPAPESCHAIAAAVGEALKCKESGEKKVDG